MRRWWRWRRRYLWHGSYRRLVLFPPADRHFRRGSGRDHKGYLLASDGDLSSLGDAQALASYKKAQTKSEQVMDGLSPGRGR